MAKRVNIFRGQSTEKYLLVHASLKSNEVFFVTIQRINSPFAPAHSTWRPQRDVSWALQTVAGLKTQPRLASRWALGKRSLPGLSPRQRSAAGMSRTSSDRREQLALHALYCNGAISN